MAPNKIHIIGGPGSGKSYLAHSISSFTGCPHYDLDDIFWDNSSGGYGVKADPAVRDDKFRNIVSGNAFILRKLGLVKSKKQETIKGLINLL